MLQQVRWRAVPQESGWITGLRADLVNPDGSHPDLTEIQAHHATWGPMGAPPTFGFGQEKSVVDLSRGLALPFESSKPWFGKLMLNNLTDKPRTVKIVIHYRFVPSGAACAKRIEPVALLWPDAYPSNIYPVFDIPYLPGRKRPWIYPRDAARDAAFPREQEWLNDGVLVKFQQNQTLVFAVGHLHPGALYADLWLRRGQRRVRIFRSHIRYFSRGVNGNPTRDMGVERTPPNWRVAVRPGDVLEVSAAFDVNRAAWYQQMAIMPVAVTLRPAGGLDPFRTRVDPPGQLTHGRLPENRDPSGAGRPDPRFADARRLPDGERLQHVNIRDFRFLPGDLRARGRAGLPPVVQVGTSLEFINLDAHSMLHSVTACRQPCTGRTGGVFPLADGRPGFDSGDLGYGHQHLDSEALVSAANRDRWRTPRLSPGTYTYFCRIHPFMRGAFRVR